MVLLDVTGIGVGRPQIDRLLLDTSTLGVQRAELLPTGRHAPHRSNSERDYCRDQASQQE